jgi:hypothetical protein
LQLKERNEVTRLWVLARKDAGGKFQAFLFRVMLAEILKEVAAEDWEVERSEVRFGEIWW